MMDADKRKRLQEAKAKVRELERPEREAQKIRRVRDRRERNARVGKTAEGQRKPRQRDNAYLAATRREPCLVGLAHGGCEGRIDPAHLRFSDFKRGRINPGKGAKPSDRWCSPLCRRHHDEQHARGNEAAFWEEHGFADIGACCEDRYAAFQANRPTTPVLLRYAHEARLATHDGSQTPLASDGEGASRPDQYSESNVQ